MWKDIESTVDYLGYTIQAKLLSKLITNPQMLPVSIGIFGNWGSGKSSLMLLLEKEIAKTEDKKILQIRFNSWQFENYEDTKFVLMDSILREIKSHIEANTDIWTKADDFISKINYLKAGLLILRKLTKFAKFVPGKLLEIMPSSDELKGLVTDDQYSSLLSEFNQSDTSLYVSRFRKSFEEIIEKAEFKAVVVYIDDLDRCAPDRIIECLEAIKLFLNVNRTAFVLGADERIIEYAIKNHYPSTDEVRSVGRFSDYLEKLIQIPYRIPKLSKTEQETYLTLLLCQKYMTEAQFKKILDAYQEFREREHQAKFGIEQIESIIGIDKGALQSVRDLLNIFPLMYLFLNGNPRQMKRFLNTFDLRMQMADVASMQIKNDVLVKLMVLEYNPAFRANFEDLYRRQAESGGVLNDISDIENITDEKKLPDAWSSWDSPVLRSWLSTKPSLADISMTDYFWVSRESLDDKNNIDNSIPNLVRIALKNIMDRQGPKAIREELRSALVRLSQSDVDSMIYLINQQLVANPKNEKIWEILNADMDNLLVGTLQRFEALFNKVTTNAIEPVASRFFHEKSQIPEISARITSMNLSNQLEKAIKFKANK
jgi:hypothetical protein